MAANQNELKQHTADEDEAALQRLKSDIDHTRMRMDRTLDQLARQLQPRIIMDTIMQNIKESSREAAMQAGEIAKDTGRSAWQWIRHNPLPTALIASGVAYLVVRQGITRTRQIWQQEAQPTAKQLGQSGSVERDMESASQQGQGVMESARQHLSHTARKMRSTARQGGEQSGRFIEQARDWTVETGQKLREKAHEAGERLGEGQEAAARMIREHPVAIGAAIAAIGALAGALLPGSRQEDRLMGESADAVKERAQQEAKRKGEQLGQAVKQGAERVSEGIEHAGNEVTQSQA